MWFFKKYLFIYSWERESQRHRQKEKQAPCREPDAGLDPGTPGSCPGPKAGAKRLSHPGIPTFIFLFMRDTQRERQRHRQKEKQAPCRERDVGLDPRTPGSCWGPKTGAQLLSRSGIPLLAFVIKLSIFHHWYKNTHRWEMKAPPKDFRFCVWWND